jgi:osmoprotectant transport system permease protein
VSRVSKPGLLGAILALTGLVFADFAVVRPNRLAPGDPLSIFAALPNWTLVLFLIGFAALTFFCFKPGRNSAFAGSALPPLLVLGLLWAQGAAAARFMLEGGDFTRVSLGAGLWLALLGLFIVFTDMVRRARPGRVAKFTLTAGFAGGLVLLAACGALDKLSPVLELASRGDRFLNEFKSHLFITGLSIGFSGAVGVPLGVLAFKRERLRSAAFSVLNVVQTIPSLALFGLLIAPLAFVSAEFPLLKTRGVRGIGWAPAVIALSLYALLPIVRNTFSGFETVDEGVIDAGRGMGMGRTQMFFRVELPLAAPIILNGLRIAGVQNIGNTAVAALIGAGGFGVFIFQGLGQAAVDLVLLGAVPTILLAVAADCIFQAVINILGPGEAS